MPITATNFGDSDKPTRTKWSGFVLDFNEGVTKTRELRPPRHKIFTCWADSYENAHHLLHKIAENQGYALGGVKDITNLGVVLPKAPGKRSPSRQKKDVKRPLTVEEMQAQLAKLEMEIKAMEG